MTSQVISCASLHELDSSHWPHSEPVEAYRNATYNCLQYQLSDGAYVVVSADVQGIYGNGESAEAALEDFRRAAETRVTERKGGVYLGTSAFEYQEESFRDLEEEWAADEITIVERIKVPVTIFVQVA